jgi:cobalt/nickel transport system permease protein
MADALLSPAVGATFWAGSLASIAYSAKKLKENIDEKLIPLMGVIGAFVFAAQMINFTIPGTGSSGHLGGGMILAVILGPYAAFIVISSILIIQSLFFADGGILALGCNIWNLGFFPSFIVYPLIYKTIVKNSMSSKRITVASLASTVINLQLGALSLVLQTLLSGKSELTLITFSSLMLPLQLVIGIVEGFITAGVINFVKGARPEILEHISASKPLASRTSIRNVILPILITAVITGGIISWFASTNPDSLEWSIKRIYGNTELGGKETGITSEFKKLQEKTAILPDYNFPPPDTLSTSKVADKKENSWPKIKPGTSVSGLVGGIMVLFLVLILGIGIKSLKRTK